MTQIRKTQKTWRGLAAALGGFLLLGMTSTAAADSDGAAVGSLLRERGQAEIASALPQGERAEEAELARLLSQPLNAEVAVRVALLNHGGVRAALHRLGIPRGQLLTASLPPNPEIEVSLRSSSDPGQPLQADIGIDYDISGLILLPLRRSAAKAELAAARQQAAASVLEVAYLARISFYDVAARTEQLALRQQAFAAAEASFEIREELMRKGNIPALELHQERAALEAARLEVTEAELALREAREQLNAALGLRNEQTRWSLAAGVLAAPINAPGADIEQRVAAASFELNALRSQAEAASKRGRLARVAGALPHLSAGFHGERDEFNWELGGHFTVGLPLFNAGQGHVAVARAEASTLRAQLVAAEASLRARVRAAQARLELNAVRARTLREGLVPARERALKETQLQYNGMQVSAFQLLAARRQLTEAQVAAVEAQRAVQEARAAIEIMLAGHHFEASMGTSHSASSLGSGDGQAH